MAGDDNPLQHTGNGGSRPVPDPTLLTTESITREVDGLRVDLLSEVGHAHDLFTAELSRIEQRFDQKFRDLAERTAEQKKDTKDALDAALAAAKEAVASQSASSEKSITKSETATIERIKGVETLVATGSKATDDKIGDLKDRVIAIESARLGSREQSGDWRTALAIAISVLVVIVAAVAAVVAALHP